MTVELPRLYPVTLIEQWGFFNGILCALVEHDGQRLALDLPHECDPFEDGERWYLLHTEWVFIEVETPRGPRQELRTKGDPIGWCKESDIDRATGAVR